ncbi:MAG: patatin-like phospholipase family protein [Actinomycetota bacterium]|nr:patatin-like phospholipase family protein [Actinomycetota bacterium]
MATGKRVGVVLAGGGARGAYEAGALSVLLPELERRGERPTVIVGTSTGALNAAFLAAKANCEAKEATRQLVAAWSAVTHDDVLRPVLGRHGPMTAVRFAGEVLGLPKIGLSGLLDPAPLRATLDRLIDWPALHRNVADGVLDCVAVAACDAANPRSVVFVEGAKERRLPPPRAIEYVACELSGQHVRASSAIPVLFPAVRIDRPADARGWYFDGGTRLNTPVKPALDLDIDRLVIIGTHSIAPRRSEDHSGEDVRPDFADGTLQLLHATLVDPLTEDIRRLGKTNLLVRSGRAPAALAERRRDDGRTPYRRVPYMYIAPRTRGALGDIASAVFARRYRGHRGLRAPELALLSRLLGGPGEQHGELISYILFEPAFHEEVIALGCADARRWLERVTGPDAPWYTEPIDTLPDS